MNKTNKFINKVTFSSEEEELFRRLEEDDSLGTCVVNPHATPLEKAKYNICQTIVRYQMRNDLSEKEVAERLELDEQTTSKILRCRIKDFDLNELTICLGKIYSSGLMNNKGEFASIPPFIELAGGEKVVLSEKTIKEIEKLKILSKLKRNISEVVEGAREIVNCLENLEKMCNPMEESSDVGLLDSSFIPFTYIFVPKGEESLARKLIFDSLGDLTAEQLKKIHFLKREKTEKERSFGFKVEKNITSPNFFFTDPSYQEVTMPILAG
ncbi:5475_t:CDS:2 [Funneliformis geosporum]|uniref:5475_t:CDS:1 n=1 Tax=Funneliformis geosporum TaxID=1117311 RepID=A0A9W4T1L1_9GLOM|nr:5475_t:CDS:2 [Funneliformis geosporum]